MRASRLRKYVTPAAHTSCEPMGGNSASSASGEVTGCARRMASSSRISGSALAKSASNEKPLSRKASSSRTTITDSVVR